MNADTVRISRPAPTSNNTESAICDTTKMWRSVTRRWCAIAGSCLSAGTRLGREARTAGASPKTRPEIRLTTTVNVSTRG